MKKNQETSGFVMYFREYRKRPVQWNGLNIPLTNTLCQQNVKIYACSITIVESRVKLIAFKCYGCQKMSPKSRSYVLCNEVDNKLISFSISL